MSGLRFVVRIGGREGVRGRSESGERECDYLFGDGRERVGRERVRRESRERERER